MKEMIEEAKRNYFQRFKEKEKTTRNSKFYYLAVKMLSSKEAPKIWDIRAMFPGEGDAEIADK